MNHTDIWPDSWRKRWMISICFVKMKQQKKRLLANNLFSTFYRYFTHWTITWLAVNRQPIKQKHRRVTVSDIRVQLCSRKRKDWMCLYDAGPHVVCYPTLTDLLAAPQDIRTLCGLNHSDGTVWGCQRSLIQGVVATSQVADAVFWPTYCFRQSEHPHVSSAFLARLM